MAKRVTKIENNNPTPEWYKRVGIYCRVSTASSAQVHSLAAQASYLLQYSMNHRGWIVTDIYIDISSGSSIEKRPEFMRLIQDVQKGKINQIITKSVSRFGRNTIEVLESYRALKAIGAEIYFEEQDLYSSRSDCEVYLSLYSASAENENLQLSENIKWGIRKRALDGTSAIYNRPCYGYRVNADGEFEIAADEASVVREIYSMYINGMSVVKIKQALESVEIPSPGGKKNWSKHTIETILSNKKYIGASEIYKTYQQGYPQAKRKTNRGTHDLCIIEDHHIPIIPKELFEAVQKEKAERTNIEYDAEGHAHRKATKYSAATVDTGRIEPESSIGAHESDKISCEEIIAPTK